MAKQVHRTVSTAERPPTQGRIVGRMQREYRYYRALLDDPRTPNSAKWLIGGGVGYLLMPVDLIPDFIPIIGKIDDMLIAPALIGLGMKLVPEQVKNEDRNRSRRVRVLYDDQAMGPVLFESKALPSPFGICVDTCGRDAETQGPILFPLLDLMYEFGLVVITDTRPCAEKFDSFTMQTATIDESGPVQAQTALDVNFRPLPLVAAIVYFGSESSAVHRFINTEAAYVALPPDLNRRIHKLRLRWRHKSELHLDAVLNNDGEVSCPHDEAHVVTGAQFINLLMSGESRIVNLDDAPADRLRHEMRQHMSKDEFCYSHQPSAGELLAWNPRRVLHVPSGEEGCTPRIIYPRQLSTALLGT